MSMLNVFDSKSSKVLLGLAIVLIAGFQYKYWLGEGGHHEHLQLMQKIQQQIQDNEELKERNRVLAAEVYDLKNGKIIKTGDYSLAKKISIGFSIFSSSIIVCISSLPNIPAFIFA